MINGLNFICMQDSTNLSRETGECELISAAPAEKSVVNHLFVKMTTDGILTFAKISLHLAGVASFAKLCTTVLQTLLN